MGRRGCIVLFVLLGSVAQAHPQAQEAVSEPVRKLLDFDARNIPTQRDYRIAVLAECPPPGGLNDGYCRARLRGLRAAAKKYGFELEIYFANFDPDAQRPQVEAAASQEFDGYLFAPTAAEEGRDVDRPLGPDREAGRLPGSTHVR